MRHFSYYPNTWGLNMDQETPDTTIYKHSIADCTTKLNGISRLLDIIASSSDDPSIKHITESAQALCKELLQELR
jgi:hypothetical protein